ncbi:uncharacterized protein F4822DRAFT_386091 [Hypoxylon trugodes]|uniref:uncharacterized protein n=1 Tax=Hypoxylon trugodes TaxID=326681 RepID=UPI00219713B4|nr:uncharacterized protein F4822DRAFT_386091 [Hypoxylon trugodes]KAI1393833.1 hypothetical protein F4822DRAFT_386091 [Hypoxylon trugodes]
MEVDHIDKLLEQYLNLLHEYTTLRDQLNSLQTGIYQNIARANFAAERGMRYNQDHYDERMQASRRLTINTIGDSQESVPIFTVSIGDLELKVSTVTQDPEKEASTTDSDAPNVKEGEEEKKDEAIASQKTKSKDPLRWFGLLTPMSLRQAQAQSIKAVEGIIPKLVSVNAQMAQVEIEVRRARKKRAKLEAAAAKKEHDVGISTEITA